MPRKCAWLLIIFLFSGEPLLRASSDIPMDQGSVFAGGKIAIRGDTYELYKGSLKIGDNFIELVRGTDIDFPFGNRITLVSVVPSIDTPVCETQTSVIGSSERLNPGVDMVTISRDLPFAQDRFAKTAGLKRMQFASDYKSGSFGKAAGLMIKGKEILARAILILDKDGVIRYIQVVPELSHLPNITQAINEANHLAESGAGG